MVERVPPGPVHDRLQEGGARLAAALDSVRAVCVAGERLAPSEGEHLPGGHGGALLNAHRVLARGATVAAQASETVALVVVALRSDQPEEALRLAEGAIRAVAQVADHVGRAEEWMRTAEHG
jgi:hypothetical protein